jgi:acyl carrier protein
MSTTTETLHAALIELGVPGDELAPEALLRDDLEIDSTELVEIVASVVQGSGLRIGGKDLAGVRTLGQLADLLDDRLAQVA